MTLTSSTASKDAFALKYRYTEKYNWLWRHFSSFIFSLIHGQTLPGTSTLVQPLSMAIFEVWTCIRREVTAVGSSFPFKKQTDCGEASSRPAFSIMIPNIAQCGVFSAFPPLIHAGWSHTSTSNLKHRLQTADLAKNFPISQLLLWECTWLCFMQIFAEESLAEYLGISLHRG